jgi:creatinine amidohydrolase
MKFQDHNWMQIEAYLKKDDRILLVLGACEQHGHLSLLTDVKIPLALAEAASQQSGVVVAPSLNFGCSPYFLEYPGTISLQLQTYLHIVGDIIRSLYGYGFRRILILNGHGGNTPVKTHLVELTNAHKDLKIRWYAWWMTKTVSNIAKKYALEPEHANWLEAFDFTKVTALPEEQKDPPNVPPAEVLNSQATRETYRDGSFGGAYEAPPRVMEEIFQACLEDVLTLLRFDS